MNDNGYAIVKQFQDNYMGSRYLRRNKRWIQCSNIKKVAEAYGLTYVKIKMKKI